VQYFSKLNQKTNKFFIKELNLNQLNEIDVLYSNSVIQYLKSLDSFFNLIDKAKPNIILIDDVQISTSNDFISSLNKLWSKIKMSSEFEV
jgi:hypothetical protein